jgi:hypothetical protein
MAEAEKAENLYGEPIEAWKPEDVVVQTDVDAGRVSEKDLAEIGARKHDEMLKKGAINPGEDADAAMQEELDRRQAVAADAGDIDAMHYDNKLFDNSLVQEMSEKGKIGKEERDRQDLSKLEDIAREILPEYDSASQEAKDILIAAIRDKLQQEEKAEKAEKARVEAEKNDRFKITAATIANSPLSMNELIEEFKKNPIPVIEPREIASGSTE